MDCVQVEVITAEHVIEICLSQLLVSSHERTALSQDSKIYLNNDVIGCEPCFTAMRNALSPVGSVRQRLWLAASR